MSDWMSSRTVHCVVFVRSAFTVTVVNSNNQGETSMNRKWVALVAGADCLLAGGSVLAQEGVSVAMATGVKCRSLSSKFAYPKDLC